jgi:sulfite exporter TauE/SafE
VLAYANRFHGLMRFALIGSDLFIIVVGLGTAGLFRRFSLMRLEFAGPLRGLVRAATALTRMPGQVFTALPLGLLMGFLPCGFSYAMIITAAQTSSLAKGGLTMLSFGLGTSPALLLFGGTLGWLGHRAREWMLRAAGLLVAAMGLYHLGQHIALLGWDLSGPLSFFCH